VAGGAGGMAGLSEEQKAKMQADMMNNPDSVKMMSRMMDSMDPKTLAAMSKQAGMEISEEQAAKVGQRITKVYQGSPQHGCHLLRIMECNLIDYFAHDMLSISKQLNNHQYIFFEF
jgi:hypothetical protein